MSAKVRARHVPVLQQPPGWGWVCPAPRCRRRLGVVTGAQLRVLVAAVQAVVGCAGGGLHLTCHCGRERVWNAGLCACAPTARAATSDVE